MTDNVSSLYDKYWTEGVAEWQVGTKLSPPVRDLLLRVVTGRRVLDFGGGDGERYGRIVRSAALSYTVADISPVVLERRTADGDDVVSIGQMDHLKNQFDAAICLEVLEHLVDPLAAVEDITRTLVPGGRALFSVPNAFSALNRIRMLCGRLPASGVPIDLRGRTYIAPHIRFFDSASLVRLVTEGGLSPEEGWTDRFDLTRFAPGLRAMRQVDLRRPRHLLPTSLFLLAEKPMVGSGT